MRKLLKNKKGQFQFLLAGVPLLIAIIVVAVVLILGGIFVKQLLTTYLWAIIGSVLLIGTLFVGLKPVLENPNTAKISIFSVLMLIGIGMVLFSFAQPQIISQTTFSTPAGDAESTIYSCGWLCSVFKGVQQTVYFSPSEYSASYLGRATYKIGDKITFYIKEECYDYVKDMSVSSNSAEITTYFGKTDGFSQTNKVTLASVPIYNINQGSIYHQVVIPMALQEGTFKVHDAIRCYRGATTTWSNDGMSLERTYYVQSALNPITCPIGINTGNYATYGSSGFNNVASIKCEK